MGSIRGRSRGRRLPRFPGRDKERAKALVRGAMAVIVAWAGPVATRAQQSAVPATPLVFDGVTVVDVEHGKLLPAQRVVVAGNRIQVVGEGGAVKLPAGARVVDARGKYLIPGLWDMHTHPMRNHTPLFFSLFIAHGVTGIRDGAAAQSGWIDSQVQWRSAILAGARVGPPRQLLTGTPGRSYEHIAALKDSGANFLKVYPFSFELAAAARRAGIPFGGHVVGERLIAWQEAHNGNSGLDVKDLVGGTPVSAIEASDSGIRIVDHVMTAGDLDRRCVVADATAERCQPVAERFRQNGTWWVPTLITVAPAEVFDPDPPDSTFARVTAVTQEVAQRFLAGSNPQGNWLHDAMGLDRTAGRRRFLSLAERVGVPILAGTDVGDFAQAGFELHAELAILVAEGLTPLEALQAATLNPAKLLHGTDSLGTVAVGKLADLVLLDADPLADITNTTTIRAVVANGRYFDRAALDQLLAEVRAKAKAEQESTPEP